MSTLLNNAFIHPASRADLFKSKSFTENIITNIIRVCSPLKSFVIDDNEFRSAFYDESKNSEKVLAMVINGYYVEVPVNSTAGMKAFWIVTEELGYDAGSPFVGMREAVGSGDPMCFVYASSDQNEIPAGNEYSIIVSDSGIVIPNPWDSDQYWSYFNSEILKTNAYSCFYVGENEPSRDKLWIVSNEHFITKVYFNGAWVKLGAVYKSDI